MGRWDDQVLSSAHDDQGHVEDTSDSGSEMIVIKIIRRRRRGARRNG